MNSQNTDADETIKSEWQVVPQNNTTANPERAKSLYTAVSRWHFHAGLIVLPLLCLLACTGSLMLLQQPIDAVFKRSLTHVQPGQTLRSPSEQVAAVHQRYPHARIDAYWPPSASNRSARVAIASGGGHNAESGHADGGHGGSSDSTAALTVYVDPYTSAILGAQDPTRTIYAWANTVHGTLLLGVVGDAVIETAAGLAVLMIISGIYLAWPRNGMTWYRRLFPGRRARAREWHAGLGVWIGGVLLCFLISGLAWTGIWGGQIVQAWSAFPAERFSAPTGEQIHAALNRGPLEEVPWALERTPIPTSGSSAGTPGIAAGQPVDLDRVVAFARMRGFNGLRVNLPRDASGAWTISATTMGGEVLDPRLDRTLHLDRDTGRVLADVGFTDYSAMGKAMAAGIPLHQGGLGIWNWLANIVVCLGIIGLCLLAVMTWWRRRPSRDSRLASPPKPADPRAWRQITLIAVVLAMAFPLSATAMIVIAVLDTVAYKIMGTVVSTRQPAEFKGR